MWQDWEHEREIAARIRCALCGGDHFAAQYHNLVSGIASERLQPRGHSEPIARSAKLPWYVGYTLPRNVGISIFLAWYVLVLAALTVAGGYIYGL